MRLQVRLRKLLLIAVTVASSLILSQGWMLSAEGTSHFDPTNSEESRIEACRSELLARLNPKSLVLDDLEAIQSACYMRVEEEDELSEYSIRRHAYEGQQSQTSVLMWMVIAITISGVVLAGTQLLASYKLAVAGKAAFESESKMDVEAHKFSMSSSVSGLLILVISFAFFYVFTHEIYTIHENGQNQPLRAPGKFDAGMKPGPGTSNDHSIVPMPPDVRAEAERQRNILNRNAEQH